jgi:hypothetical protein
MTGCSDEVSDDSQGGAGSGGAASAGKSGASNGGSGASSSGAAGKGSGGTSGSSGAATAGSAGSTNAGGAGGAAGMPAAGRGAAGGSAGSGAQAGSGGSTGGNEAGGETGDAGDASSGGASGASSGGTSGGSGLDAFGVRQIYPSASSGAEWTSEHWQGDPYEIDGRTDPNDPLGISGMRGDGTLEVTGDGELVMSGSQPRIYVYPTESGAWRDVEVTAYYQRVEDSDTAYAGLVIGVRSGEDGHTDSNACDAHTYYARVRNDGAFDFEKELEHPASSTQSRVQPEDAWPDGEVPRNTWIGFKFVIYNLPAAGQVKFEAYRDMTEGEDGGDWELVNETIDDGGWFVESGCSEHAPNGDGESDLVVTEGGVTFIRNTDVTEARYRWVSVREIRAE